MDKECPRCGGRRKIRIPYDGPMEDHFGQGGWGFPQYQYVSCPECGDGKKKDREEYSRG
jgi:rRNA maturation protein Nop10